VLRQGARRRREGVPAAPQRAIDGLRYLAMTRKDLGHHDVALELSPRDLRASVQIHGDGSGMALDARGDLARTLGDLGYDQEAATELAAVANGFITAMGDKSVNAAMPGSASRTS